MDTPLLRPIPPCPHSAPPPLMAPAMFPLFPASSTVSLHWTFETSTQMCNYFSHPKAKKFLKIFSVSFSPPATTSLLYGKIPKKIIDAFSFHFLSSQSLLTHFDSVFNPRTPSKQWRPHYYTHWSILQSSSPYLIYEQRLIYLMTLSPQSTFFPWLPGVSVDFLLSYTLFFLNLCRFLLITGPLYLEITLKLSLWTPSLFTLIILVISFSSMLLNSINKLMTPRFVSMVHISPLISRHIHSTTQLTSLLGYLIGIPNFMYPKQNSWSVPKACFSHSHPHLWNGNPSFQFLRLKWSSWLFSHTTHPLCQQCCWIVGNKRGQSSNFMSAEHKPEHEGWTLTIVLWNSVASRTMLLNTF